MADVREEEEVLVVPLPFPFPLLVGACLCVVAALFFDTPDVGVLAGDFLTGVFLVLAMAENQLIRAGEM